MRSPEDYFGGGTFDEDEPGTSDISIGLDTGTDPDPDPSEEHRALPDVARAGQLAPRSTRAWPGGTSPEPADIRIDEIDVAVTAAYGDSPSAALATPGYAIRVLRRKRALRSIVADLSASLSEAEKQRDELLVRMVQDVRGKISMTEEGATLLEPIVALERIALERRSALAGTSSEYDARVADLGERRQASDREAEAQRAVIEQRTASLADIERAFERADARKKRLYIELGGLVSLQEKSGGKLTPEQTASVARLEAEILAQKPEVDATSRAVEASKAVLAGAQADLRKLVLAGRELERLSKAVDSDLQKRLGARSQGVADTDQQCRTALAELGRKILREKGRHVDVQPDVLGAIALGDGRVLDRAIDLEKHVRARDAYDPAALRRGLSILGGTAVTLVVIIILLFAR